MNRAPLTLLPPFSVMRINSKRALDNVERPEPIPDCVGIPECVVMSHIWVLCESILLDRSVVSSGYALTGKSAILCATASDMRGYSQEYCESLMKRCGETLERAEFGISVDP